MRAALPAIVVIAALAAGCGSSDADVAERTVSTAISGLSKGDEKKVCAQLTPEGKRKLLVALADNPLGIIVKARTCEEAITKLHAKLTPPMRAVLEDGEVDDARVTGDRAVVHVVGAGMDVQLEKIAEDDWKIVGGLLK